MIEVLCIVGSVRLKGNKEAYDRIDEVINRLKPAKIISGGAKGIDTMTEERAKHFGIPFEKFPPTTQKWPAFKVRNLKMAKACTYLVRIVSSKSTTYGSGWTRDRAKEMGKPTEEYII